MRYMIQCRSSQQQATILKQNKQQKENVNRIQFFQMFRFYTKHLILLVLFLVRHGRNMIYVPDYIPRMPQDLREYLKQITEGSPTEREAVKIHYQEAVSELHYVPEIQLLELVSKALTDNSTQEEILKPFHALCFNLLKAANTEFPSELRALHDLNESPSRQRRCQSLETDPNSNNCLGMCGKGCSCWTWVCGDCCFHRGCYLHDLCCRHDWWSTECITPWFHSFSCSNFGGYPGCFNQK